MSDAPSPRLIALIVACAMFMAQLDGAIVALALPDMGRSFDIPPVQLAVGITAYLWVQVLFLPTGSWIADRFGARRVFAAAIAVFTIASVLCALSHTLNEFVAARILQGCAAALMAPVGRIVLLQSTEKENLLSVMTISTIPMLVAPSLGPAIGGFITTYWSWQWIFLLNVPIGIAGVLLVMRFIPNLDTTARRPFDTVGFLLFAAATTLTLYALDRLGADCIHWQLPTVIFAAGLLFGYLAVRHVRTHEHPIISLGVINIPTYAISTLRGGAVVRLPVRALSFILPMMFQLVLGLNAFRAGILLLALNGGDLVLKVITTRTLRHFGFRDVLILTAFLSSIALGACAWFTPATPYMLIFAVLLVSGMFRSLLFTGMSTLAFADVPRNEMSSSSTLWNVIQQFTNVLGVSLSAILLAVSAQLAGRSQHDLVLNDFQVTLLVMAALGLISVISFRHLAKDAGASVSGHRPAA